MQFPKIFMKVKDFIKILLQINENPNKINKGKFFAF